MKMGKIGELEIENTSGKNIYEIKIDIENKLMYFIENGTNEPTLCVSIDSLFPEEIQGIEMRGAE